MRCQLEQDCMGTLIFIAGTSWVHFLGHKIIISRAEAAAARYIPPVLA